MGDRLRKEIKARDMEVEAMCFKLVDENTSTNERRRQRAEREEQRAGTKYLHGGHCLNGSDT